MILALRRDVAQLAPSKAPYARLRGLLAGALDVGDWTLNSIVRATSIGGYRSDQRMHCPESARRLTLIP